MLQSRVESMSGWYPKGTVFKRKDVPSRRECASSIACGFPGTPSLFRYLFRSKGALVPIKAIIHGPQEPKVAEILAVDASLIPPVIVCLHRDGRGFRLIDGSHRLAAIKGAGEKLIRAVIVEDRKKGLPHA